LCPAKAKQTHHAHVGMAADGLGFYLSHFAKPLNKKTKRVFIGLVKVIEGLVSAEGLERDFGFHFPWGKMWKATKCHSGFLMQFPSQERLDEMISFPELKMKMSGAKIVVVPWSSRAKPKSRLHTVWVVAENVPEQLQNYQSICEIGSMIGAVEEVDLMSLDSDDIVRFKIHIKSVAMIPPVVEVAVKPFLYDIFFRIESICDEGWNDDSVNLGKRASVQIHGINDPLFDKSGKNLEMKKIILMWSLLQIPNWGSLLLMVKKLSNFLTLVLVFPRTNLMRIRNLMTSVMRRLILTQMKMIC
jgi:hypothetical protein